MFIREYKTFNKKTQTTYSTHRLVESYRTKKGARQRIILHLGTLTLPKSQWRNLAIVLESRLAGKETMIEPDSELYKIADNAILHNNLIQKQRVENDESKKDENFLKVDISSVNTQEHRSLGPELVANTIWEKLGFSEILSQCSFSKRQIDIAKIVISGRLISPSSDLDTWKWYRSRTSFPDFFDSNIQNIGKDQVYEIVDILLLRKNEIELLLRKKEDELFPREQILYLYDLTNTYFEGSCIENEIAKRGKCKSKRSDCPLVTLALMVNSDGFPIYSEIYPGNQSEPETFENVIDRIQKNLSTENISSKRPTIAMDRGIATADNLLLLKKREYNYVLIERKAIEKKYIHEFESAKETFNKVSTGRVTAYGEENSIYLKRVDNDDKTCRILCLSIGRERKEQAINKLSEDRFIKDLTGLRNSIEKTRYVKNPSKVNERIGRIKQKYSSIAKNYDISIEEEDAKVKGITWNKKEVKQKSSILDGCYVIETTHKELDEHSIWKLYMTLTRVESAFKALKSELGMRPVYHKNAERTKGHLFVSVLAYHLLITISNLLDKTGDFREWTTIKKVLSTHQRCTVIMKDEHQGIHHIRVNGTAEMEHKEIYEKLGINNPLKVDHRIAKIGAEFSIQND